MLRLAANPDGTYDLINERGIQLVTQDTARACTLVKAYLEGDLDLADITADRSLAEAILAADALDRPDAAGPDDGPF